MAKFSKRQSQLFENIQQIYESITLLEDRMDFLKKNFADKLSTDHDALATHKEPEAIINHFANNADPTKKKVHTQWILNQYNKKNIRQEDAGRIRSTLSDFEKHKSKLDKKDIGQYKDIGEVSNAIKPHIGAEVAAKEKVEQAKIEGHHLIHKGKDVEVYHTSTEEASKAVYGKNGHDTAWCTAEGDSRGCMFNHYHKQGKLYQVHTKNDEKSPYQLHFESNQFMDRHDRSVDINKLAEKHPELRDVKEFKETHYAFNNANERKKLYVKHLDGESEGLRKSARATLQDGESDPEVLHHVATHLLSKPESTERADSLKYVVDSHSTSPETIHHIATNTDHATVFGGIATAKNTSTKTLDHIYDNSNGPYKRHLAGYIVSRKNASPEVLDKIVTNKDIHAAPREKAMSHPNLSKTSLDNAAKGLDTGAYGVSNMGKAIADNPKSDSKTFEHLAKHKALHPMLAVHPKTPDHFAKEVLKDPDTAQSVAFNKDGAEATHLSLIHHYHPNNSGINAELARHDKTPDNVLMNIIKTDKSGQTKADAVYKLRGNDSHAEIIKNHPDMLSVLSTNHMIHGENLHKLVKASVGHQHEDFIHALVSQHPDIHQYPKAVDHIIKHSKRDDIMRMVSNIPNISKESQEKLHTQDSARIDHNLAKSSSTHPDILHKIAVKDLEENPTYPTHVMHITKNPNTSEKTLHHILDKNANYEPGDTYGTLHTISSKHNLSSQLYNKTFEKATTNLDRSKRRQIHLNLAGNSSVDSETLEKVHNMNHDASAPQNELDHVNRALLYNKNTPDHIVKKLADHPNYDTASIAKLRLNGKTSFHENMFKPSKSFKDFLNEREDAKEFHVGEIVKINKPDHKYHGQKGVINHSSNILGHDAWEGHNPESPEHLVMFWHNDTSKKFKDKDIFKAEHLVKTGTKIEEALAHDDLSNELNVEFDKDADKVPNKAKHIANLIQKHAPTDTSVKISHSSTEYGKSSYITATTPIINKKYATTRIRVSDHSTGVGRTQDYTHFGAGHTYSEDEKKNIYDTIQHLNSLSENYEELDESAKSHGRRFIVRFRGGKRQRVMQCPTGFKRVGNRCVRISSIERQHRKMGHRKATRTLRAKGTGFRRRANFKRQRSMLMRKRAGL